MKGVLTAVVLCSSWAMAQNVPAAPALAYTGFLEESGAPVTGTRSIGVTLYAQPTGGSSLCTVAQAVRQVRNGYFRVPLGTSQCDDAIKSNGEVWVEVQVEADVMPRTQVGAVPYALRADMSWLKGAVVFFAAAQCPPGWSVYLPLAGRAPVGVVDGGVEASVGTALTNQENRAVGQHTHAVTDPGHAHSTDRVASTYPNSTLGGQGTASDTGVRTSQVKDTATATTNISLGAAGAVSGTNAPYLQLLPCVRN